MWEEVALIITCAGISAYCFYKAAKIMAGYAEQYIQELNDQFDSDEHIGI